MPRIHYVYWLAHIGKVIYVGRSLVPKTRRTSFERRTGIPATLLRVEPYGSLEAACEAEKVAIAQERPAYNQRVSSSPGMVGKAGFSGPRGPLSLAHRQAISAGSRGKPKTFEHAANISAAMQGHATSASTREAISRANKGKGKGVPKSPAHRAKLALALAKGRETMRAQRG